MSRKIYQTETYNSMILLTVLSLHCRYPTFLSKPNILKVKHYEYLFANFQLEDLLVQKDSFPVPNSFTHLYILCILV